MTHEAKQTTPAKLDDGQVSGEIVNDSLGTVDTADTMDTDPEDDPEATGIGSKGNEA
jgi:hypothetical protein